MSRSINTIVRDGVVEIGIMSDLSVSTLNVDRWRNNSSSQRKMCIGINKTDSIVKVLNVVWFHIVSCGGCCCYYAQLSLIEIMKMYWPNITTIKIKKKQQYVCMYVGKCP